MLILFRFYEEIKTGLVPFMDNKRYGRSPLEAASFIVSSAFPDPKLHGASFLARLSGSTAEMLSMWAVRCNQAIIYLSLPIVLRIVDICGSQSLLRGQQGRAAA